MNPPISETPFQDAAILLAVGMITVFVVLSLVVLTGNLIIRIVNRYYSETKLSTVQSEGLKPSPVPAATVAAIVSAVDLLTAGKGRIIEIQQAE